MAINPLYGYDTSLYGYGQANTAGGGRKYPGWMTDTNARGIGVAQNYAPTAISPIDIPRGNGLGGFNDQSVAPAAAPVETGFGGGQATYGAEGAGAVGGFNDVVNNQPAPGWLADIIGSLGLSTGQYGGSASSNIDNQGKAGDLGGMNDIGGGGAIGRRDREARGVEHVGTHGVLRDAKQTRRPSRSPSARRGSRSVRHPR